MEKTSEYLAERGDFALMKDVSYGNHDAFMVLVERHLDLVSRTSFRILCDRVDSEAVTVRVFMSLWDEVLAYDDKFTLEEWLLKKTWIYSRLRIMRRRLLSIFGETTDLFVRAAPKVEDHDDYVAKQAWELFCRASAHMTPLQSVVYSLYVLEGIDVPVVSWITGFTNLRVSVALQRASEKVREELKHFDKEDDYERFTGFLSKVAEGLTAKEYLMDMIRSESSL